MLLQDGPLHANFTTLHARRFGLPSAQGSMLPQPELLSFAMDWPAGTRQRQKLRCFHWQIMSSSVLFVWLGNIKE